MKALLLGLQTVLKNEVAAALAVHLLADEDLLPYGTPFPCIGLKDGDIEGEYFASASDRIFSVDIVGYVEINSPEGVIAGDAAQVGILDFVESIKAVLLRFNPTGYQFLSVESESASQAVSTDDRAVQKKKITMKWTQ